MDEKIALFVALCWPVHVFSDEVVERVFWIGALSAAVNRVRAHVDGDLGDRAAQLLARWPPLARA